MINLKCLAFYGQFPIPTEMIFTGEDPYRVQFIFHQGGETTPWHFSKELLDTLEENSTSGDGDVKFELMEEIHTLYMHLTSPDGSLTVEFDPCVIQEFLEEVNLSTELAEARVDITDDEIYDWLNGEAA